MALQPQTCRTSYLSVCNWLPAAWPWVRVAREVFAGTDIAMTACWNATLELWDYHRELADGRGHECDPCSLLSADSNHLCRCYIFLMRLPPAPCMHAAPELVRCS